MALRIRLQNPTGASLGYSIERLSDGLLYDFSSSTFVASPSTLICSLPEDSGNFIGRYKATLAPTPVAQFTNGDYIVTIHDRVNSNAVVAELPTTLFGGNDTTMLDPWSVSLPGSYPAGSAGSILGTNLNVPVSTRSTYSGGPVASVAAPVTVGANNDKSGYLLGSSGLDAITIEAGINPRQALSTILAWSAGVISGAGTGTLVIKGARTSTTRIVESVDNAGNRSSVTLTLPT
jgi:hypothetical protein